MRDNIADLEKNIVKARVFLRRYGSAFKVPEDESYREPTLTVEMLFLHLDKSFTAEAGKVFGTDGWIRKGEYGSVGLYSWQKTIDDVRIQITNAENVSMEETPVPSKAFPIQLEDATPSAERDEIPF